MKRIRPSLGGLWALGVVAGLGGAHGLAGCGSAGNVIASADGGSSGAPSRVDGAASRDGQASQPGDAAGGDGAADGGFCAQTGPVITLPGSQGSYTVCTSQIASNLFADALCACDDVQIAGYLQTSSFNSAGGSGSGSSSTGAAVGINNSYRISAGYTEVGGSLSIAGPNSVAFIGYVETYGDLTLLGAATIPGYTRSHRNGWLGGNFTDLGPADFTGNLRHQGSVVAIPLSVGGTNTTGPVSIPPPCACGAKNQLDVAAIVAQGLTSNDDAAAGLAPGAWTNVLVNDKISLPCGRYYLDSIRIAGSLEITLTGRVAMFIGADITVLGNLQFHLGSNAELDLFVANDLNLVGLAVFGDKSRPAATRIYVGGSGNVNLVGVGEFVGNLYAPSSIVTAPGYVDVYGSIFSKDFQIPGYADFHYDSAITQVGNNCAPAKPPGGCQQCGQCTNGQACVGGACGACTKDADCCGQLVCNGGQCVPLVVPK